MSSSPVGDGTVRAVFPDPAATLAQAPVQAWWGSDHGDVILGPDPAKLPHELTDHRDGRLVWPAYVALLAAVVQDQQVQIAALTRLVVDPDDARTTPHDVPTTAVPTGPGSSTPPPSLHTARSGPPRHAAS